jgi:hypothetical protein
MPIGTCLCGDIAYEIAGPFHETHHCHCSFCRKEHGTPYATYGIAAADGMKWLRGQERAARFESSEGFYRVFCPRCGSILPGPEFQGLVFVPIGNLDGGLEGDPGAVPSGHIFAASNPPWWEICDGLPQHAEFPPGFGAPSWPTKVSADPPGRPRGSCLCGRVGFVLEAEPLRALCCYCVRCRKARAAAHATNLVVPLTGLRFTRGESELETYRVPEAKFFAQAFCRHCGASMPRVDRERGFVVVPMGALDDDPGIRPQAHIFVASKAPWIGIHDELPRYDEGPPPLAQR